MHAQTNYLGQTKTSEPVSSTSRRGARAAYYDEYLRYYTVSLVSDTSRPPTLCRPPIRHGGREAEKCRPLEHMRQVPINHQLCSHPILRSICTYIQICSSYFFHVVIALRLLTFVICACALTEPHISRFSATLFSSDTYWYEMKRDTDAS